MHNLSYKSLFLIVIFLLIPIVFLLRLQTAPKSIFAAWWNDSWTYRQRVDVSGVGSTNLTDFQVSLTIGTSALISSGKMQSDCDDIRITDQGGNILPHWIEENNPGCNSVADTKIWIKITSLPTSGAPVYVYYGNPSATNTQNGNDVFEFFDDFNNGITKWGTPSCGTISSVSGSLQWNNNSGGHCYLFPNINIGISNVTVESRTRYTTGTTTTQIYWGTNARVNSTNRYVSAFYHTYGNDIRTQSSLLARGGTTLFTIDTWYQNKFVAIGTSLVSYRDDSQQAATSNGSYSSGGIGFDSYASAGNGVYQYDYVFARKAISSSPSVNPQSEETGGGPVAWWKFDEGVGTTAFDSSGQNNHGVFGSGTSTPAWQTSDQCLSDKCLKFDGNDSISATNLTTTNWTASLWLKITQFPAAAGFLIAKSNYSMDGSVLSNGKLRLQTQTGTHYIDSNTILATNQWYFVTFQADGTNIYIYINGQLDNSAAKSRVTGSGNVLIGKRVDGYFFNGLIDDVKIYPYARSASQIKADYTSGLAGQSSSNSSTNIGQAGTVGLSNGLIAWWKFDEGLGTTSADSSGNNNLVTFATGTSAPSWSSGKYGTGLNFTGSNYLAAASSNTLQMGTSDWTINTWILSTQTSGNYILLDKRGSGPSVRYQLRLVNNKLYAQLLLDTSNQASITGNTNIADGQWHSLGAVYDRDNNLSIYVDGKLDGSTSITSLSSADISTANPVRMGTSSYNPSIPDNSNFFIGSLDEVRIYNRALNPTEVKELYEYTPGPIGYWKFEEASGTTTYDSSGSNRHATLQNGAVFSNGKYGKALALNIGSSANQYASFTSISHNYGFTKSAWIYPLSTAQCPGGRCSVIGPYFEILSSLQYYDYSLSPPGWHTGGSIPLNQWSYVTVSYDNNLLKLFFNGTQIYSIGTTNTGTHYSNAIGALSSGQRNFHGLIDEVKIYNYARTQSQILEDMNVGSTFVSTQVGQTSQTIGGTTTNLEYCIPGDTSHCASPIAEWKFEEGVGTTAYSQGTSSSNATMATGTSSPSWNNGRIGKSLLFDGNDYLYYPKNLLIGVTGMTVSAWFKTSATNAPIITEYQNSSGYQYRLVVRNGLLSGCVGTVNADSSCGPSSVQVGTSTPVNDNQWHFATLSYDNSFVRLYLDGQFITQYSKSGSIQWNAVLYPYIGTQGYNTGSGLVTQSLGYFNGSIDHVRIYNYARTPAQIAYDYNKGEPVGWWKLDECQGATAYDSSGMSHNGTINIGASGSQTSTGTCTTSGAWFNGANGKNNNSLNFDGVDDHISTPSVITTTSGTSTTSLWVKLSDSNNGKYLFSGINSCYQRPAVFDSTSRLGFYNGTAYVYGSKNFNDNSFHHIVIVDRLTPSRSRMTYVDGVADIPWNDLSGAVYGSNTCHIDIIGGYGGSSAYFNGQIDDVRVYNYALTSTQVKTLFNGGALNFR